MHEPRLQTARRIAHASGNATILSLLCMATAVSAGPMVRWGLVPYQLILSFGIGIFAYIWLMRYVRLVRTETWALADAGLDKTESYIRLKRRFTMMLRWLVLLVIAATNAYLTDGYAADVFFAVFVVLLWAIGYAIVQLYVAYRMYEYAISY